jgi:drug/metabolite transporter (DMT)-like permease
VAALTAAAPDNRKGAVLLVLAAVAFTAEVIAVRLLDGVATNAQVVFARGLTQCLLMAALVAPRGLGVLATRRPLMHLLRALTSLFCWWLYYRSFQALDFALATTLTFTSSLFVVALAGPVLGERPGAFRWAMTALGFFGVAVASGADGLRIEPAVLLGLGAAAGAATLVLLNRVLSRTEATLTIMAWIGIIATLTTLPFAVLDWRPLAPADFGLLALAGSCGTLGLFLTVEAYRVGEVSALAPFPYLRLVMAVLAGFMLFGEWPSLRVLAGSALILVSALAVMRGR